MLLTPLLPARTLQVPINNLINQTSFQPELDEKLNKSDNTNIGGTRFYQLLNINLQPSPTVATINFISNQSGETRTKLSVNDMLMNATTIDNLFITQRIKKNSNSSYIPYSNKSTSSIGFSNVTNINIFNYNNYSAELDSVRDNKKQTSDLYLVRTNLEKNISYAKSNGNIAAAAANSKVTDANSSDGKKLQITFYANESLISDDIITENRSEPQADLLNILFATIVLSLIFVLILSLIGVVRCLRATRDTTGALALPTTVLSEDRTPLNTEINNTVPMLSVQSPGCAGMERLGIPVRSSYGSPSVRDNRGHSCRLRSESSVLQSCDISTMPSNRQKMKSYQDSNHHHTNIEVISCPHHIPLADGEWGPDRDLQIRTPYQQTEITRTYIKAPPNKTAFDIPEQSYKLFSSTSSCNLNSHRSLNSLNMSSNTSTSNISISPATSATAANTAAGTNQQKSKANAITKFLLRISSNSKSTDNQSGQQQHAMGQQQQHHHLHQQQLYQHYNIKNSSNSSLNNTSLNSVGMVQQQQQHQQQQGFGSTNQNLNNINNHNNNNNNNNNNNSDTNSNNSYSPQQTDS